MALSKNAIFLLTKKERGIVDALERRTDEILDKLQDRGIKQDKEIEIDLPNMTRLMGEGAMFNGAMQSEIAGRYAKQGWVVGFKFDKNTLHGVMVLK